MVTSKDSAPSVNWRRVPNPLYDATIETHSSNKYYDFTDNFYAEWQATRSLKATVRIGWDKLNETNPILPSRSLSLYQLQR